MCSRSQQSVMLRLRPCMLEVIKRAHVGDPTVPSCSCILFLSDKARRFTVTLLFHPHCIFNEAMLEHSELRAVPGVEPPMQPEQPECKSHRLCLCSTAPGSRLSWASLLSCFLSLIAIVRKILEKLKTAMNQSSL